MTLTVQREEVSIVDGNDFAYELEGSNDTLMWYWVEEAETEDVYCPKLNKALLDAGFNPGDKVLIEFSW